MNANHVLGDIGLIGDRGDGRSVVESGNIPGERGLGILGGIAIIGNSDGDVVISGIR